MGNLRGWEWLIILLLVLVLFGAKKLPEAARGLGRSLKIFKAETKGLGDDAESKADTAAESRPAAAPEPRAVESPKVTPQPDPGVASGSELSNGSASRPSRREA